METISATLDDLLNHHFPGKVVRKDLTELVKKGANVPNMTRLRLANPNNRKAASYTQSQT